jgi:ABC-type amino acid transport system permease subunit
MRLAIFPQAIRLIIPALVTQLVSLQKDSTLGYAARRAARSPFVICGSGAER